MAFLPRGEDFSRAQASSVARLPRDSPQKAADPASPFLSWDLTPALLSRADATGLTLTQSCGATRLIPYTTDSEPRPLLSLAQAREGERGEELE